MKLGKQGSTLAGVMDAFSIAVSIGLQYGVPLEQFAQKFTNLKFEPAGMTDDPDVRMAQSIMDYIFRRLAPGLPVVRRTRRTGHLHRSRAGTVCGDRQVSVRGGRGGADRVRDRSRTTPPTTSGCMPTARNQPALVEMTAHSTAEVLESDFGVERGRTTVPHLRHQDATLGVLLHLRGLRLHQRVQLSS